MLMWPLMITEVILHLKQNLAFIKIVIKSVDKWMCLENLAKSPRVFFVTCRRTMLLLITYNFRDIKFLEICYDNDMVSPQKIIVLHHHF